MKRAIRRHHVRRLKAQARLRIIGDGSYAYINYTLTARNIGRSYQVHGAFCSRSLCHGNPRRYEKNKLTIQERRNYLRRLMEKEEISRQYLSYKSSDWGQVNKTCPQSLLLVGKLKSASDSYPCIF